MPDRDAGEFDAPLGGLVEPVLADLAAQLGAIPGLADTERAVLRTAAEATLRSVLRRKLTRLLVLELNAARITGQLRGPDAAARWTEFMEHASRPAFWRDLAGPYPTLPARLHSLMANRCAAVATLAARFAADRPSLAGLLGRPPGMLVGAQLGAGDSHLGGHSVAKLSCSGGTVVYKPRSVAVDAQLQRLLDVVLDGPPQRRIRVPAVLERGGNGDRPYGWAEYVEHRYCAGAGELAAFYRGIGHWIAIMRLVGGSDLHAENLIACGPVPVVVDCETLFTPHVTTAPTGLGLAVDRAVDLITGSVLRSGLLPGRGLALGWRGVDVSGAGALSGEQPVGRVPVLLDAGSDQARIGTGPGDFAPAANHPSREAVLQRYWDRVVAGFDELTGRLTELDRAGRLTGPLAGFADCPVRAVLRATEVYAELGRMLWHPVSLSDEPAAVRRAAELLAQQAANMPGAPADPAVVQAEVAELLVDDVPVFGTLPRLGRFTGPGGTSWGDATDLVRDTVLRWRGGDLTLEREVIQTALVSAYLNDGGIPDERQLRVTHAEAGNVERRRRALLASLLDQLAGAAVHGDDGTVTWIAPSLSDTGWAVRPLGPDQYGGLAGLAYLLAAYQAETAAGRVDEHPAAKELVGAVLTTLRAREDWLAAQRRAGTPLRPEPPGGYLGLGSQISAWLLIHDLPEPDVPDALPRARALAELLPEAIEADEWYDVLTGMAGAVEPLLRLAARTGEDRWLRLADSTGERLAAVANMSDGLARWPNARYPGGLGGFAHGSTGIGWALSRLATATDREDHAELADAAFAFEHSLWEPGRGWQDLRHGPDFSAHAWCNGSAGIGLVAADLLAAGRTSAREQLRRAAATCWVDGMGWTHTLCHGDFGNLELYDAALSAGVAPAGVSRTTLHAQLITSVECHGPVSGLSRDAFTPGLLMGIGGIAYQLLRMHPECPLPSVLLPGRTTG